MPAEPRDCHFNLKRIPESEAVRFSECNNYLNTLGLELDPSNETDNIHPDDHVLHVFGKSIATPLSALELRQGMVKYITDHREIIQPLADKFLSKIKSDLDQYLDYLSYPMRRIDEFGLTILGAMCLMKVGVVGKKSFWFTNVPNPDETKLSDCDILFVYRGCNTFRWIRKLTKSKVIGTITLEPNENCGGLYSDSTESYDVPSDIEEAISSQNEQDSDYNPDSSESSDDLLPTRIGLRSQTKPTRPADMPVIRRYTRPKENVVRRIQPPRTGNTAANTTTTRVIPQKTHGIRARRYSCKFQECKDKKFDNSNALKSHVQQYHKPKKYSCHRCDKTFRFKSMLEVHKQSHGRSSMYKCGHPGCTKKYKQKSSASRHELSHTKWFYCDYCDFKSRNQTSCIDHIESHEIVRECNLCGATFTWRYQLYLHEQDAHFMHQK